MRQKSAGFQIFILIAAAFAVGFASACSSGTGESATVAAAENFPNEAADQEISSALKLIEKMPDSSAGYVQLAVLYIKKARSTGDFALNSKAETAVRRALEIEPASLPARKLEASLALTFHNFPKALELGLLLQKENASDSFVYGVLTDAEVELGNYKEAVEAAQRMVDLKPNTASYARVAHLRSLNGDSPGAIEMMTLAARTADPQDREAQSWCLVQLGKEYFKIGDYARAEKIFDEALQIFPGYYLALAEKGNARAALNDFDAAVKFLIDANNRVPNVEVAIRLGDIYTRLGDHEKAGQQYALVEVIEQKIGTSNDRKRLALLWADQNIRLDEALEIARRESETRKDIYTADALAWTLFKKGALKEAKTAIDAALRLKTNDARILYHAGIIEKASGRLREAKKLLETALKLNPAFDLLQAENARAALVELN